MIEPNPHLVDTGRIPEQMGERRHYVCLDRNERTVPFPEPVFQDMLKALRPELFNQYPDPTPLYERLARQFHLPNDFFYVTNGSDAAIRMLFQTFLRPNDAVALADPTY